MTCRCPVCNTRLKIELHGVSHWESILVREWPKYLLWCLLSKPKHEEEQWWYDPYHNSIEFIPGDHPGEGTVKFSIQIEDSYDGDTWVHGEVPLVRGQLILEKAKITYSSHP